MKQTTLSAQTLSQLFRELELLLRSGILTADALRLLEEDDPAEKALLADLAGRVEEGHPFSDAMEESGVFPRYAVCLSRAGERSGRQEEAIHALADYYESMDALAAHIRGALPYPLLLLVLMAAVILILLAKVLPVFASVYARLGAGFSGVSGALLGLGLWMGEHLTAFLLPLAVLAVAIAAVLTRPAFRLRLQRCFRGSRLGCKVSSAQFAAALAMALASALPAEEAMELAASLHGENPAMTPRCETCLDALRAGKGLGEALGSSGLLSSAQSRMLSLGIRGGSGDTVMADIARRLMEDAQRSIQETVGKVEPAIVVVSSLLIGGILLAVMLPLVQIMSVMG